MHKKSWRQGKCISNLIRFFFFLPIFIWHSKNIFFKENRYDTHFLIFRLFIFFIQNKILFYYKKGTEWKTIFFFVFFKNSKHIFLVLTRVKSSSPTHVMQFIDTKRKTSFFIFFLTDKSQHVYMLYYQPAKEILEQRCLFTCPKFGQFRERYGPT